MFKSIGGIGGPPLCGAVSVAYRPTFLGQSANSIVMEASTHRGHNVATIKSLNPAGRHSPPSGWTVRTYHYPQGAELGPQMNTHREDGVGVARRQIRRQRFARRAKSKTNGYCASGFDGLATETLDSM